MEATSSRAPGPESKTPAANDRGLETLGGRFRDPITEITEWGQSVDKCFHTARDGRPAGLSNILTKHDLGSAGVIIEAIARERQRVADLINRDRIDAAYAAARVADEREREKRRNETFGEWRSRLALLDQVNARALGPLLTPEAEENGEFTDVTVERIDPLTNVRTRARTKRRQLVSSLELLLDNGALTIEQHDAGFEIAVVVESLGSDVSMRGVSYDGRVDGSGSGRDVLIERLGRIRLERAYREWFAGLPIPHKARPQSRVMFEEMLLTSGGMAAVARQHGVGWPRARRLLIDQLDRWINIRTRVWRNLDARDALAAYWRLGVGQLAD